MNIILLLINVTDILNPFWRLPIKLIKLPIEFTRPKAREILIRRIESVWWK